MTIPSHFLPINNLRLKPSKRSSVKFEKSESNADAGKKPLIVPVEGQEKRKGEDRRKRNIKPLIDTRSGRDRRYENNANSVDIKA